LNECRSLRVSQAERSLDAYNSPNVLLSTER
jgi:hypothetical protein